MNPESDCPFSEARQPPYIHEGNAERLSNISESVSDCSSMSQRKIPESSFSEQHDKSDDNQKKMSNKTKHSDSSWEIRIKMER